MTMPSPLWIGFWITVGAITAAWAQTSRTLRADLAFHFECPSTKTALVDPAIERFLQAEGFRVLNLGKIQREHGVGLFEVRIVGIDDAQRMVNFIAIPKRSGFFAAGLNTQPPTRRSTDLETRLESFPTRELGCRVYQVTRGENGPEAADLFQNMVARVEGWFKQANELKHK